MEVGISDSSGSYRIVDCEIKMTVEYKHGMELLQRKDLFMRLNVMI